MSTSPSRGNGAHSEIKSFAGKSALVTGAGTGIGRAAALTLAAEGCFVTVAGRTAATLEDTVCAIEEIGGHAGYAVCDVADETAMAAAVKSAVGDRGRLDFAVNAAGVDGGGSGSAKSTAEYPVQLLDRMIATNVRGMFLSLKYELQQMQTQGFGSIVNISSAAGLVGIAGNSAWSATQHAEIGMTKSAALEYAKSGIRINAICPWLADVPPPIGRIVKPGEIADAVVWLCSNESSYLVGAALPLDGGHTAQ